MNARAQPKFSTATRLFMIRFVQRHLFVLKLLVAVSLLTAYSCKKGSGEQETPIDAKTMAIAGPIGSAEFVVEIADTAQTRAIGLSKRKSLPDRHGMLFIFDRPGRHPFWMKDTYIPLDLIFFDNDFKVVGIREHAEPLSLQMITIDTDYRYVLEVLAGSIRKYGIREDAIGRILSE